MTRRGNHEGSVRERPGEGRWEARYVDASGRRRSIFAPTDAAVREALRRALDDASRGVVSPGLTLTVGEWLDEWLATFVTPRLRRSTSASYAEVVKLYLKPALGKARLAKLTPEQVQRMLADLAASKGRKGEPLSPTTVRYAYAVLRIALGRALKSGRVSRNVATLVDPPGKAAHELHPLTAEQARAFLASVKGDRLEALYIAALSLGLRQGELLALCWSDVDLAAATLIVRHTLERGTHALAEPKTERARRVLALPKATVAALTMHKAHQAAERIAAGRGWKNRDLVFTTPTGTALDTRNVTRAFQLRLERAGLPHQRFHDLRHACATFLLEGGEELAVVSKILGHSDLSTTADVYAHLTGSLRRRAAERMDAILAG